MSDATANLALPFLLPSQAQKHVTHNDALLRLDALVQLSVLSTDVTEPPATPADGDRYIVPSGATGAWAGRGDQIAFRDSSGWIFLTPGAGWIAWVGDRGLQVRFDGSGWVDLLVSLQDLALLGVQAVADATNRLSVSAPATLLTHEGAGHQLKINKAAVGDTASLLFQSGWAGRAEIGLVGSDSLAFKVSDDGTTFRTALTAAPETGIVHFPQGATGLTPPAFGPEALSTPAYLASFGGTLVSNAMGHLPEDWNLPGGAVRDSVVTPGLPASFSFCGYAPGLATLPERIPVDPNTCYSVACYLRQGSAPGDWSAFAEEDRHRQAIGLACFDVDGLLIEAKHHMRYRAGGTDSRTTLAAPLAPGDSVVSLVDAAGWNDSDSDPEACGIVIFGYVDSHGRPHDHYSRHTEYALFLPSGVNKTAQTVTLTAPFPAEMGNPADPDGIWPTGTALANTAPGQSARFCVLDRTPLPATETCYMASGHIGMTDLSGSGRVSNFAPGTATVSPAFLPNESNHEGGWEGYPDTGAQHIWFAGPTVVRSPLSVATRVTSGATSGTWELQVPTSDAVTGQIELTSALTLLVDMN